MGKKLNSLDTRDGEKLNFEVTKDFRERRDGHLSWRRPRWGMTRKLR